MTPSTILGNEPVPHQKILVTPQAGSKISGLHHHPHASICTSLSLSTIFVEG
jgi:hypothetical protein